MRRPYKKWHVWIVIALLFSTVALANQAVRAESVAANARYKCYVPIVRKFHPPLPATPLLLSIGNSDGDGNYVVRWNAVAQAQSYELEEKWQNLNWFRVYQGSATEVQLRNRVAGDYSYRCRARNSAGDSPWSNVQTVKVQGLTPSNLTGGPSVSSTNTGGRAVLKVANDSPYGLRLDLAGPQPQWMEVPQCDVCEIYVNVGPSVCPAGRPASEIQLTPGQYRVFIIWDNPTMRPAVAQWTLLADHRYFICLFIVRRTTSGEAVIEARLCAE